MYHAYPSLLQISECAAKGGECDESKGRPVCGTDNQTYPTRCHLIRAQCSGHQVSIKHRGACKSKWFILKSFVILLTNTITHSLDECMASRQYALSHRSTTKFIPRCRADGSYAAIQCLLENHNCWCVTSDGKPIPNTASQNARPNCQRSCKYFLILYNLYYLLILYPTPSQEQCPTISPAVGCQEARMLTSG